MFSFPRNDSLFIYFIAAFRESRVRKQRNNKCKCKVAETPPMLSVTRDRAEGGRAQTRYSRDAEQTERAWREKHEQNTAEILRWITKRSDLKRFPSSDAGFRSWPSQVRHFPRVWRSCWAAAAGCFHSYTRHCSPETKPALPGFGILWSRVIYSKSASSSCTCDVWSVSARSLHAIHVRFKVLVYDLERLFNTQEMSVSAAFTVWHSYCTITLKDLLQQLK